MRLPLVARRLVSQYPYLLLIFLQLLLLLLAFPAHFMPGGALFCNSFDGFKNYFTLLSYVKEPVGKAGLLHYGAMAYPFGDYIYYTDSTPLFSVSFKWICLHVVDLSPYTLLCFNGFILANFVVASVLVFYVFRKTLGNGGFAFFLAVVLPWVNTQCPRIWLGHFNLSYSSLVLGVFALMVSYAGCTGWQQQWRRLVGMVVLLVMGFLVHGYYIAILGVLASALLLVYGLSTQRWFTRRISLMAAILVPVVALVLALAMVQFTDGFYALRKAGAMGYDHADLKTNFLLLFTHYGFHHLSFPVASTLPQGIETMSYLGNIGLFILGGIAIGAVFSSSFRMQLLEVQAGFFGHPLLRALFWGGTVGLFISFGEYYETNNNEIRLFTPIPALNQLNTNVLLTGVLVLCLALYGIGLLFSAQLRRGLQHLLADWQRAPLRKLLFLMLVGVITYLFIGRYSATIPNVANPFFYLHFVTKRVEQFRCLARFAWPFFWSFYLWAVYTYYQLWQLAGRRVRVLMAGVLATAGLVEMSDYILAYRETANNPNVFAVSNSSGFPQLKADTVRYSCLLPLPLYMVGSEDYDLTIDDDNNWGGYTMRYALHTGLPLMACKLSRTPPVFSDALLRFVASDTVVPLLRPLLTGKHLLIMEQRQLLSSSVAATAATGGRPLPLKYYQQMSGFIARHHLTPTNYVRCIGNVYCRACA
ncbi:MAG: hypothetical protein EBZ77_02660 [Chitinophagia bacterium]|nr:hypothetical protein [Chitinophagia bacterium]